MNPETEISLRNQKKMRQIVPPTLSRRAPLSRIERQTLIRVSNAKLKTASLTLAVGYGIPLCEDPFFNTKINIECLGFGSLEFP